MAKEIVIYLSLLDAIKGRIRQAQTRAVFAVNREMQRVYWEIGGIIVAQQKAQGWGTGVLAKLAGDLKSELPGVKGFSERNLKRMTQFYRAYPSLLPIGPPPVAQLEEEKGPQVVALLNHGDEYVLLNKLVFRLPWAHNMLLLQKVKALKPRCWYMEETLKQGWSRNILDLMIKSDAHGRQGKATHNLNVVDDVLRHEQDNASIGLILC